LNKKVSFESSTKMKKDDALQPTNPDPLEPSLEDEMADDELDQVSGGFQPVEHRSTGGGAGKIIPKPLPMEHFFDKSSYVI
jgi:hypothetical protein